MKQTIVPIGLILVVAGSMIFLNGCAGSAQKTAPHMGFGNVRVEAQFDREDVVVLDSVQGDSTITSILFGLINIVDGDKLQICGIKFFKDKYTYFRVQSGFWAWVPRTVQAADRAYYKALEAHPDADVVFVKSMDHEDEGIPLIYHTKSITFKGKAVKLKADQ